MKKIILFLATFAACTTSFSTTWTVTNSGFSFSPSSITIVLGDDVNFTLESIHNAVEVSQATWNSNGNTPLPGGFQTSFGGGLVSSSQLGVGTHYYVCSPHASSGMKGVIIVQNASAVDNNRSEAKPAVYPNPSVSIINILGNFSLTGDEYSILDRNGRLVSRSKLLSGITSVDISQLSPGVYLILIGDDKRQSVRFIKN